MATWVTHLMIADAVLESVPELCRQEFCVGNIAPDCNVENEDWTSFTPSREVTHWMDGKRKSAGDGERFLHEYIEKKPCPEQRELSFLLGYYAHLLTDAAFQDMVLDPERVRAVWERIRQHPELGAASSGMEETWASAKKLIPKEERLKDIDSIERDYLDLHPDSGYLTEILPLTAFPDYLEYLPHGAVVRKIGVMGYLPEKKSSRYPFICLSPEEYQNFVTKTTALVSHAIRNWLENHR